MRYAIQVGLRYLRSKKRDSISTITLISIFSVGIGVAALLVVLGITTGFEHVVRQKILGVNGHVLVMKYGIDFEEYRDVIERAEALPEVAGAGPFVLQEMMLAKGERLGIVLVKGIDPSSMRRVLDLPNQIVAGSLDGLRRPGARPPMRPADLERDFEEDADWLERLTPGANDDDFEEDPEAALDPVTAEALREQIAEGHALFGPDGGIAALVGAPPSTPAAEAPSPSAMDAFEVASPEEIEAMLGNLDLDDLPDEAAEGELVEATVGDRAPVDDGRVRSGIIIGRALADELHIEVGEVVRLVSPMAGLGLGWASSSRQPESSEVRVVGIFSAGFHEYDSHLVYTDLFEAQRLQAEGDTVTGVEIRLHDMDRARDVARRLERDLGGPFHTIDWAELNHNLFTVLQVQKVMLSLAIGSIICVAAFMVIATLIMIVLEKKREIAILKAMGATDGAVLLVFMVQGIVVGVFGTLFGLVVGGGLVGLLANRPITLDPNVYLIDHVPVVATPVEFVVTAAVALVICTLATLAPSWWAARMLPVDGVRYE